MMAWTIYLIALHVLAAFGVIWFSALIWTVTGATVGFLKH